MKKWGLQSCFVERVGIFGCNPSSTPLGVGTTEFKRAFMVRIEPSVAECTFEYTAVPTTGPAGWAGWELEETPWTLLAETAHPL